MRAHGMHVQAPTALLLARLPVQYYVFDLLEVDDQPLLTAPFLERRELLAELDLNVPGLVHTSPHYTDITGPDLPEVARESGLEGILRTGFAVDRRSASAGRAVVVITCIGKDLPDLADVDHVAVAAQSSGAVVDADPARDVE